MIAIIRVILWTMVSCEITHDQSTVSSGFIFFVPSLSTLSFLHTPFTFPIELPNPTHQSLGALSLYKATMATLRCELCKHIYKDAGALKVHSRDYHDGEAGRIAALLCPRAGCDSRLMTRSGFRKHLKAHAIKDIQELGYALDEQILTSDELVDFGPVQEVETNVGEEEEEEDEDQVDMCPFCGKELAGLGTFANHLVHHLRQRAEALIRMDQHTTEESMEIVEIVEIIPGIRYGGCGGYNVMTTSPPTLPSPAHGYQQNDYQQDGFSSWNTRAIQDFEAAVAQLSREVEQEDQRATWDRAKEDLARVTGNVNTAEFILSFLEPVVSTGFEKDEEDEEKEVLLRIKRPSEMSCIRAI